MAKKAGERFQTPAEFVTALDSALADPTWKPDPNAASVSIMHGRTHAEANPFAGLWDDGTFASKPATPTPTRPTYKKPTTAKSRPKWLWPTVGGAGALLLITIIAVAAWPGNKSPVAPTNKEITVIVNPPTHKSQREIALEEEKKRQAEQKKREAEEEKRRKEEEEVQKKRAVAADADFPALETKFQAGGATFESFAKEVAAFKGKHGGTPAAIRAAEMLMKLPSPLDALDPKKLPQDCLDHFRAAGVSPPSELVGVLGEHRGRHWDTAHTIAFSPDGSLLASGGWDKLICIWDRKNGNLVRRFAIGGKVACLCFSPDGKTIAVMSQEDSNFWLLESTSGKILRTFVGHAAGIWAGAFSSDGKRLLTGGSDKTMRLWDVERGTEIRKFEKHTDVVIGVTFSPDNLRALSGSNDGTAIVWEVESGAPLWSLEKREQGINKVAFADDGSTVICSTANGMFRVVDAANRKEVNGFGDAGSFVNGFVLLQNGKQLICGNGKGEIFVWDASNGKLIKKWPSGSSTITTVARDPAGTTLATAATDGTVRLWDVATGKEVLPLTGPVGPTHGVAFAPDLSSVATVGADGVLRLWNPATGKATSMWTSQPLGMAAVAFSPDGTRVATVSDDRENKIRIGQVGADKPEHVIEGVGTHGLAFSPDGRVVISGSYHHPQLRHTDAGTGASELFDVSSMQLGIADVAFSPDGRKFATAHGDNSGRVWDLATKKVIRVLPGHEHWVLAVAFSPDGQTVATAGNDKFVWLWDLTRDVAPVKLPTGYYVGGVAFSPDGRFLASLGSSTLVVWDVAAQKKHWECKLPGAAGRVRFAADGRHLATANGNGTVYILRLEPAPGIPVDKAWLDFVAALPGPMQVEVIRKKLQELNPGFDGKFAVTEFTEGKLTRLTFSGKSIVNIAPLAALRGLPMLEIHQTSVTDLSPLAGLKLTYLNVDSSPVRDLKPLVQLTELRSFHCYGTPVEDLTPLKNLPLERLVCRESKVQDFTPVVKCPLRELVCDFVAERDKAVLSRIKSLETINGQPAAQVLKGAPEVSPMSANEAKQRQADTAKALGVPVEIENSIGMKLRLIPAGKFLMGAADEETEPFASAKPRHLVHIRNHFLLGIHEVTQKQYQQIVGNNPSQFKTGAGGGPDHPVEKVTWAEAVDFCKKLSSRPEEIAAGRTYRLPTEAEWEYSCRAGSDDWFHYGRNPKLLPEYGWSGDKEGGTHPVGQLKPNAWGLHDMHGNVSEWCHDWYSAGYYAESPTDNPSGPASGTEHAARGGSFGNHFVAVRSFVRGGVSPTWRQHTLGFRVVCELHPPALK
jgi:WD40 repeat protein/formylglycine-generating enzyme required for sulfatase activity